MRRHCAGNGSLASADRRLASGSGAHRGGFASLLGQKLRQAGLESADFWLEFSGLKTFIRANTECIGECRIGCAAQTYYMLRMNVPGSSSTPHRQLLTVDLCGLRNSLAERARCEGVNVSAVVRRAIERELELIEPGVVRTASNQPGATRVSVRLTAADAAALRARAKADGVSMGTLLSELAAKASTTQVGASRAHLLAALTASSADLSTLNRNVHHLSMLLRQGSVQAAREYRVMLDGVAGEVRAHLQLVSAALADLQPRRAAPDAAQRSQA
jgi:hypothetical protein